MPAQEFSAPPTVAATDPSLYLLPPSNMESRRSRESRTTSAGQAMTQPTGSLPPSGVASTRVPLAQSSSASPQQNEANDASRPVRELAMEAEPLNPADHVAATTPDPTIVPVEALYPGSVPRLSGAVVDQARGYLNAGISKAERAAIYSARADFIKVLRLVSQSLDAQTRSTVHSAALAAGLRALDEAADFRPAGSQLEGNLDMRRIVLAHRTPILKQMDVQRLTPLAAQQAYHAYAERQLALAGGHELVAADACFGLAKLQPHLNLGQPDNNRHHGPTSLTYYQTALVIYPDHYLAANELGVLFARFGQLRNARDVLRFGAAVNPNFPEIWLNLSRVHERLGEAELAERARAEWQGAMRLANRPLTGSPPRGPQVEWLDPGQFAQVKSGLDAVPPPQLARPASDPTDANGPRNQAAKAHSSDSRIRQAWSSKVWPFR